MGKVTFDVSRLLAIDASYPDELYGEDVLTLKLFQGASDIKTVYSQLLEMMSGPLRIAIETIEE